MEEPKRVDVETASEEVSEEKKKAESLPSIPMRAPYPRDQFPSLAALSMRRVLTELLPSSQAKSSPPNSEMANQYLQRAVDENVLSSATHWELFQNATEIELDSGQLSILSDPIFNALLTNCGQLKQVIFRRREEYGLTLYRFVEALRHLLSSKIADSLELKFKNTSLETLTALLGRLNKEESVKLHQALDRGEGPEVVRAWLSYAYDRFSSGYNWLTHLRSDENRTLEKNLLAIFQRMNGQQLSASLPALLQDRSYRIHLLRQDILQSLTVDQLQAFAEVSSMDLLFTFLESLKHLRLSALFQVSRAIPVLQKLLQLRPNDGEFLYELFSQADRYDVKRALATLLVKDEQQLCLLSTHMFRLGHISSFERLLRELETITPALEERLAYLNPLLNLLSDRTKLAIAQGLVRESRVGFDRLRIDLCLQRILGVLNNSEMGEEEKKLAIQDPLKQLYSSRNTQGEERQEQEVLGRDLYTLVGPRFSSLLMQSFVEAPRSQVLAKGWIEEALNQGDEEAIRTSFAAFWSTEKKFSDSAVYKAPRCLATILPSIKSIAHLAIALDTLPADLDLEERKEIILGLSEGMQSTSFDSQNAYRSSLAPEVIKGLLDEQRGVNQEAIEQLKNERQFTRLSWT